MHDVSDAYLEAAEYKSRLIFARLYFPALDIYVYPKNIWNGSLVDSVDSNSVLSLGNACARKVDLVLHGLGNLTLWRGAEFNLELGLYVNGDGVVYLPQGTFWIADISTRNNHRTIVCTGYDRMYMLSKSPYNTGLTAPFHYRDLLDEFLLITGMTLSEGSLDVLPERDNDAYRIHSWPAGEFSYSDIAGHLAGMVGRNARVSAHDPNVLELIWYTGVAPIIESTLYQDGLEKLADSELRVDYLVTGANSEIVIENAEGSTAGEIEFPPDAVPAEKLPMLAFTYDDETLTASVGIADGYQDATGAIVVPSQVLYNGTIYTVTTIPSYGFRYSAAESITLPNTIQTINGASFASCNGITEITIPESATNIGNNILDSCANLTTINFNAVDCTCSSYGFRNLKNETAFIFGSAVATIPASCLNGASNVTSVTILGRPTSIGRYAFAGCGINSVDIPDSVTSIGLRAFYNCTQLESITLPASIDDVGDRAFEGCSGLTRAIILFARSLGIYMFSGCTKLTTVHMPHVTAIPSYAFSGCSGLINITIPDSVTSIGYLAFSECSALTSVLIGESGNCAMVSIYSNAFYKCSAIVDITLYKSANGISGSPWGATNATITWLG